MTSSRFLLFPLSTLVLLAALPGAEAATFTTVGVYDSTTQTNAVDTNASGNLLTSTLTNDVLGFSTAVANAFSLGFGGVVNFDLPNGADTSVTSDAAGIIASYASGAKSLTFSTSVLAGTTASSTFNYATFTSLTPISGSRGAIPSVTGATEFTLGISGAELVQTLGFTLLSRGAQPVTVSWFLNGSSTPILSDTEAMGAGSGVDDTFFSYTAPTGSAITAVRVTFDGTVADRRHAIDDLGFITVPEPGVSALLLGSAVGLALRRRRRG